jgi:hypothetical protein
MNEYKTDRERAIETLIIDAHKAKLELVDVLASGDPFRIRACLQATNVRAASDLRLARWFFRNGVAGVWRYFKACAVVGWRQGWQRRGRRR